MFAQFAGVRIEFKNSETYAGTEEGWDLHGAYFAR
jgi:hypothetical protein